MPRENNPALVHYREALPREKWKKMEMFFRALTTYFSPHRGKNRESLSRFMSEYVRVTVKDYSSDPGTLRRQRNMRDKRRSQGLCYICGKRKPEVRGRKVCERCMMRVSESNKLRMGRHGEGQGQGQSRKMEKKEVSI